MPEGDSLARMEQRLRPLLVGRPLTHAQLRVPALATLELTGRTLREVRAYGKHLFMEFDGGDALHSHLLMEGTWRAIRRGERWPARASQVRAVLETEDVTVLGIDLGLLDALTAAQVTELTELLGPDPLHAWDPDEALGRLLARPERELGAALLDQRVVAGIGNIFRSESLFVARLNPWALVGDLPQERLEHLLDVAASQLQVNGTRAQRRTAGPTFRDRYWVYGRAGQACPRAHGRVSHGLIADPDLQRGRVGGDAQDLSAVARDVYFCARCQGVDPARAAEATSTLGGGGASSTVRTAGDRFAKRTSPRR